MFFWAEVSTLIFWFDLSFLQWYKNTPISNWPRFSLDATLQYATTCLGSEAARSLKNSLENEAGSRTILSKQTRSAFSYSLCNEQQQIGTLLRAAATNEQQSGEKGENRQRITTRKGKRLTKRSVSLKVRKLMKRPATKRGVEKREEKERWGCAKLRWPSRAEPKCSSRQLDRVHTFSQKNACESAQRGADTLSRGWRILALCSEIWMKERLAAHCSGADGERRYESRDVKAGDYWF